MNPRLAIAIVCLAIAGYILGFWSDAFGEDAWDSRSPLHLGASAAIGAGVDLALLGTDVPAAHRRVIAGVSCMAVGLGKEYIYDAAPSGADVMWDGVGCLLGIGLVEGVNIIAAPHGAALAGRW